jgi:hypothetical protein
MWELTALFEDPEKSLPFSASTNNKILNSQSEEKTLY